MDEQWLVMRGEDRRSRPRCEPQGGPWALQHCKVGAKQLLSPGSEAQDDGPQHLGPAGGEQGAVKGAMPCTRSLDGARQADKCRTDV